MVKTAETRLAVIEEQLKQNNIDHQTILGEVRHNCQANVDRFNTVDKSISEVRELIEGFITSVDTRYAKVGEINRVEVRQWNIILAVASFGAVTIVGLLIFLLQIHLK